jgi:hypothetical protein
MRFALALFAASTLACSAGDAPRVQPAHRLERITGGQFDPDHTSVGVAVAVTLVRRRRVKW